MRFKKLDIVHLRTKSWDRIGVVLGADQRRAFPYRVKLAPTKRETHTIEVRVREDQLKPIYGRM